MGYAPVTRVATAPEPDDSGSALGVYTNSGDRFPDVPFPALVFPSQHRPVLGENACEIVVTGISGDDFDFTRREPTIAIHAGLQLSALTSIEILEPGDMVTLLPTDGDTDYGTLPYLILLHDPEGYITSGPASEDGGSVAEHVFQPDKEGLWFYGFEDSDGLRSTGGEFFVKFSEV